MGIMAKSPYMKSTRKPRTFAQEFSITSFI